MTVAAATSYRIRLTSPASPVALTIGNDGEGFQFSLPSAALFARLIDSASYHPSKRSSSTYVKEASNTLITVRSLLTAPSVGLSARGVQSRIRSTWQTDAH